MAIVPSEFNPNAYESRLKDLVAHLQNEFREDGIDVTFPAYEVGEATKPYIVVVYRGVDQHLAFHSTDLYSYAVQIYVPKNRYTLLEPLVRRVKRSMREIYPMFIEEGTVSASYYDDTNQSHYVEIGYYNANYRDY